MSKIGSLLAISRSVLLGNLMKVRARMDVMWRGRVSLSANVARGVVVSLTSYGARVHNNSVSYALYSLLKQSVRAELIVLWLDETEFSESTLPPMLRRMRRWGVEIRYCSNMRSYKKILPTLKAFPNFDIVTADDDLYYTRTWLAELLDTQARHPGCIITQALRFPRINADGQFAPYSTWSMHHTISPDLQYNRLLAMPLGGFGTVYPADIFDVEVQNYELISKLCPLADDLWLYVSGLRLQVPKENVRNAKSEVYQLDLLRQKMRRDRLYASNVGQDQNDVQLHNLLCHYKINVSSLQ